MLQPPKVQHKRGQGRQEGQQVMTTRPAEEKEQIISPFMNSFIFILAYFCQAVEKGNMAD